MVRMEVSKIPKFRKLSKAERILLSIWRSEGFSNGKIAKLLGRSVSTIGREIKRNNFRERLFDRLVYEPLHAQELAEERKKKAWRAKCPLKNRHVFGYVLEKLREGWSPEQISGRLRREYPGDQSWHICPEAIYQYIYKKENRGKRLWEYLRRKKVRRHQKHGRRSQRVRIPQRVSIHLRPEEVNQRKTIGHWEGDTLVGKGRTNGLHTAYERLTSLIRLEKMTSLTAKESLRAQRKIYQPLPKKARHSTTLDNGSEHVNHLWLHFLGMRTYFADPCPAWQRGGNENANLWVRYYFPKGTDFSKIPEEDIKDVEWELNNRPRKRLGFRTPLEVFTQYLRGCTSY